MTKEQFLKNLQVPTGKIDAVLDSDAYNEIDDQFAIAYLLSYSDRITTKAIYAAPFYNDNSESAADGMEKSYNEILKLLKLIGKEIPVFKGSTEYLPDETHPVYSPAAYDLAERAKQYSPENPLYVIAIGAITNVASALLIDPSIAENIVVVWLGGHALHINRTNEFNMGQDIAAARIVMGSDAPFIQLPCYGVVTEFRISCPELETWLIGKNPTADYLARNAISEMNKCESKYVTRVIWDVTAVAWLLNEGGRFMHTAIQPTYLPGYDGVYEAEPIEKPMVYTLQIMRDELMTDLIDKLTK